MSLSPSRPAYPPRYTAKQARNYTIAGFSGLPPLPEQGPSKLVAWVQRVAKAHVRDREHLEQLKAYCRAQANLADQDMSFARSCRNRGWPESTAERNVEKAMTAIVIGMNMAETE